MFLIKVLEKRLNGMERNLNRGQGIFCVLDDSTATILDYEISIN